jgi:putative DNA primase/helicase
MNAATRYDTDPAGTVAGALGFLSPDCDRESWVLLGMAVKAALGDSGFTVWDAWSQGGKTYRAKDAQAAWKSFKADGRVTAGTLFHLAKQAGWAPDGSRLPPIPPPLTRAETEAAERALQRQHQAAARKAWNIFRFAPLADSHRYLTRKRIKGHGARLAFGKLVIPVFADPKRLVNLQFIDGEGTKRFLRGGQKAGCFWWIGRHPTETVCLAEGYATAASIHEATGHRCYIGFDAGNLPAVAEAVRALHPQARVVVCADHDPAGIKYGTDAAVRIGAALALPDLPGQDFNDLAGADRGRA